MSQVLAIESSCDETAAAVVADQGEVRSNVVASQIPVHARFGGVVPELASRNHLTAIEPTVRQALEQAGVTLQAIDAVAVTTGPGLAGCLLVGLQVAKSLAWSRAIPLVPVDHIEAHVHAIHLRDAQGAGAETPELPYLALAVSGGHTSLCLVAEGVRPQILGRTLDDAAGEAFDKVAKMLGLPYPGGAEIDRLAPGGDPAAFGFPRPMLGRGLDFSFSGLKTAVRYQLDRLDTTPDGQREWLEDLAASVQEAIVDCLVVKAMRAAAKTGLNRLVVAGGVACNSRLRAAMAEVGEARGVEVYLTPPRYCTDNAAMVGGLGLKLLKRGAGLTGRALLERDIYTTARRAS